MKSTFHRLALLAASAMLCSGCASATTGVEEMLRAPQLTGPQSQLQKALNSYLGEAPQLKYPSQGETLSPFVFGDWNGDGQLDAAALYTTQTGGQNVHLAILEQINGSWQVTQERTGLSTAVESVDTAAMHAEGGMQLLVGYGAASGEKYLAVYAYQDEVITEVLEQPYSQYEVQDITGSGMKDLILMGPETGEGLTVQLLTTVEGQFIQAQELHIGKEYFTSCDGMYVSKAADGSYQLVLDGRTGTAGNLASMVLQYDRVEQQFSAYTPTDGTFIYTDSQRYSNLLRSRDINGDGSVEIPHELQNQTGLLMPSRLTFLGWMDYSAPGSPQKSFGVADLEYGYYLALPDSWQGQVMVADGTQPGSWQVYSLDGQVPYLEVRVVSPGTADEGYRRLGNLGAQQVQVKILQEQQDAEKEQDAHEPTQQPLLEYGNWLQTMAQGFIVL